MKTKLLSLLACVALFLPSCATRNTPFGQDTTFGTDTSGYVGASGNVKITLPDGRTVHADKLLLVDKELNSPSFRDAVGLGRTAIHWIVGGNVLKSLGNNWSGVEKSQEVTARNAANNAAATNQAKIAADAATKQAQIAAEAAKAAEAAATPLP